MSITPNTPADFTPSMGNYRELKPFRFWCQKVLPLVYDDSLSYYELLCKVVDYLNKTMEDVDTLHTDVENLHTAYEELQAYVNDYFSTLDVQEEINNKLDVMASDGTLLALIEPVLPTPVGEWLSEHITNPSNPPLDTSFTLTNAAAQSKATGDKIGGVVITNTWFTNNNITWFGDIPFGTYLVALSNKGNFGFPSDILAGKNWALRVTNGISSSNRSFKTLEAISVSAYPVKYVCTFDSNSYSESNPPKWFREKTEAGLINDNVFTTLDIDYFGDIDYGVWTVDINTAGSYGFPSGIGRAFKLVIYKGNTSDTSKGFKTFVAYGLNGAVMFTILYADSSISNPSTWYTMFTETDKTLTVSDKPADGKITGDKIGGIVITNTWFTNNNITWFGDIPFGTYLVGLSNKGDFGFPSDILAGKNWALRVTKGISSSNRSFKTLEAISITTYPVKYICTFNDNSYSESNPPKWFREKTEAGLINDTAFSNLNIDYFGDIDYGVWSVDIATAGTYGFPSKIGRVFKLVIYKGNTSDTSKGFKTFVAYGLNGAVMFTILYADSSISNPSTWYTIYTEKTKGYTVVAKDGTGDYTTLTEAVANAVNGNIIYVKAGIYDNEIVSGWGKDISIIGEDVLNTVIQNGLNTYSKPPIEMSCGKLKNLTVYAYDGGSPSTDPSGWNSYGIHIDNDGLYENTLDIENCIIKCDKNASVGIGLRKGTLRFENCKFYSKESYPFYFHDSASVSGAGDEYLTVKDCYGISDESVRVMRIDSQKTEGANVYPEFINNIFVSNASDTPTISYTNQDNTGGTSTTVGTFHDLINFYQVKTSRNNYPTGLDYQYS